MDWRCTCFNERVDNRPAFTIGGGGQGKTKLLIEQAAKTNGVIVCPNHCMVDYIFHMARNLGYNIKEPIIYDEWFFYSKGRRNTKYYFDEYGIQLESIIRRALNNFERNHVKTVIIDKDSVSNLNNILDGLKVCDMNGKKLKLKIEICEED